MRYRRSDEGKMETELAMSLHLHVIQACFSGLGLRQSRGYAEQGRGTSPIQAGVVLGYAVRRYG